MSTTVTIKEWLDPPMGRFNEQAWAALCDTSEIATLTVALGCARRGDALSLAALCRHLTQAGPGEFLATGKGIDLVDVQPKLDGIRPATWRDPSQQGTVIPGNAEKWSDVQLQDVIASCLSRPTTPGGRHVASLSRSEDRQDYAWGYIPPYKESLSSAQQELLRDAMALYATIGPTAELPDGIARLFGSVSGRVAWPGVWQAFKDAGHTAENVLTASAYGGEHLNRQYFPPAVHALLLGNPVAALAIDSCPDNPNTPEQRHPRILQTLTDKGSSSSVGKNLNTYVLWLKEDPEGRNLEGDPRFQALVQLMHRVCDADPATRLDRCLSLVSSHLSYTINHSDTCKTWCEPLIRAAVQPLTTLTASELRKAFDDLKEMPGEGSTDSSRAQQRLTSSLKASCHPVLEALVPVLPQVMDLGSLKDAGSMYKGWSFLSAQVIWDSTHAASHWKQTLQMLQQAGLDPTQPLDTGHPDGGRSSLLHLVAQNSNHSGQGLLDQLSTLVVMGADAQMRDHKGKTPGQYISDKAVRGQWEDLCRSIRARDAANQVMHDMVESPGRISP